MVETWRGIASADAEQRQQQLFEELCDLSKLPSMDIAVSKLQAVTAGHQVEINTNVVKSLIHMLRSKCAIITCFPRTVGEIMSKRGLVSQLGPPNCNDFPRHAIVIMVSRSGILALDPWFESEGQPVSLSTRDFVQIWTGYVAVFGRL